MWVWGSEQPGETGAHDIADLGSVLARLWVGLRHLQRRSRRGQPLALERRAEQPVVADALEACGQDMKATPIFAPTKDIAVPLPTLT